MITAPAVSRLLAALLVGCLIATGLACGAGLTALGFVDTARLKAVADGASADRDAASFTPDRLRSLQSRMLTVGSIYLVGTALMAVWFGGSTRFVASALREAKTTSRSAWRAWTRFARRERVYALCLLLICGLGLFLRLYFSNVPVRTDEGSNFTRTWDRTFLRAIGDYYSPNNHLLNTVLMRASVSVCGVHPWSIRLPALTFGWLLVPATYVVMRKLVDARAALVAAALTAIWPYLITSSTDGRGYTCVALCFLILLWLALRMRTRITAWRVLAFGLIGALGFFAVPVMLYPFGIVLVWSVLLANGRGNYHRARGDLAGLLKAAAFTIGGTFILYTPVLVISGLESVTANRRVAPGAWRDLPELFLKCAGDLWATFHESVPYWLTGLAFAAAAFFLLRARAPALRLLVVAVLLTVGGLILVQRATPFARCLLPLLLVYLGVAAAGCSDLLDRLWRGRRFPGESLVACLALALTLGQSAWAVHTSAARPDYEPEEVAQYLKGVMQDGDALLLISWQVGNVKFYLRDVHGKPFFRETSPLQAKCVWLIVDERHFGLQYTLDRLGYSVRSARLMCALPKATIYSCTGVRFEHPMDRRRGSGEGLADASQDVASGG